MKKYSLLLALAILTFVTCKKEVIQNVDQPIDSKAATTAHISIEEAKSVFKGGGGWYRG